MLLFGLPGFANEAPAVIDRIAAVVDQQVITVSEIGQMAEVRFYPRQKGASDDQYRRDILEAMIAQALRSRDVERFGAEEISKDSIEARLKEITGRFPTAADFQAALARSQLTLDALRTTIKRQLEVQSYIDEHFSPKVFIQNEDIEAYYRGAWSEERRAGPSAGRVAGRDRLAAQGFPTADSDRQVDRATARQRERGYLRGPIGSR
jgi:SurA N-terminal domain